MIAPASILTEVLCAILGFLAVVAFFAPRRREERNALLLLAVAAYALKAVLVPMYYWMLVETGYRGFAYFDSLGYHKSAAVMAYELVHNLPHDDIGWGAKDPGYNLMCMVLYIVFGSSTIIARLMNSAFATFTLLYIYRIACIAFDVGVARVAVRLAAFIPFSLLVTINHRKEPVVIFFATMLFYHAYRVVTQQRGWTSSIPIMAAVLIPMYLLRSGFVLPFLGLFLMMLFLAQRSTLVGVLLSALLALLYIAAQMLFPQAKLLGVEAGISHAGGWVESSSREVGHTGGLLQYVMFTSPLDFWKVPVAALLLLLLPFPPNIGRPQPEYVTLLDWAQLAFVALLPQFFLGVREIFRREYRKRRLPLFIYTFGFLSVIGALTAGVLRYRETVFPIVLVITAAGIRKRQNFIFIATIYAALLLLAAVVYFNRFIL